MHRGATFRVFATMIKCCGESVGRRKLSLTWHGDSLEMDFLVMDRLIGCISFLGCLIAYIINTGAIWPLISYFHHARMKRSDSRFKLWNIQNVCTSCANTFSFFGMMVELMIWSSHPNHIRCTDWSPPCFLLHLSFRFRRNWGAYRGNTGQCNLAHVFMRGMMFHRLWFFSGRSERRHCQGGDHSPQLPGEANVHWWNPSMNWIGIAKMQMMIHGCSFVSNHLSSWIHWMTQWKLRRGIVPVHLRRRIRQAQIRISLVGNQQLQLRWWNAGNRWWRVSIVTCGMLFYPPVTRAFQPAPQLLVQISQSMMCCGQHVDTNFLHINCIHLLLWNSRRVKHFVSIPDAKRDGHP